jgi:hypothetical protein
MKIAGNHWLALCKERTASIHWLSQKPSESTGDRNVITRMALTGTSCTGVRKNNAEEINLTEF